MSGLGTILAVCSTLIAQKNVSLDFSALDNAPLILAEVRSDLLNLLRPPNCVNLMIEATSFESAAGALTTSRLKGNLIVHGNSIKNVYLPSFDIFQQSYVLYLRFITAGHYYQTYTPFDLNDKSVNREVRVGYLYVPFCPVCNHGFGKGPMDGEVLRIIQKRSSIIFVWKPANSPSECLSMVASSKADLTLFKPTFEWKRYRMGLDMSPALTDRRIGFVMLRLPIPIESIYTFGNAFTPVVWLCLGGTIALCWLSLCAMQRYHNNQWLPQFKDGAICMAYLLSEALPTNWLNQKHILRIRSSVVFWLIGQTILLYSFRSNLLSSLIRTDYKKQPETFKDLLDMKMALFLSTDQFMMKMLETSPVRIHQRVWDECYVNRGGLLETKSWPPKYELGEDGQKVSLAYSDGMPMYSHLKMGKEYLYTSMAGYYYSLKFPLQNELNMALLTLSETGIISKEDATSMRRLVKNWKKEGKTLDEMNGKRNATLVIEHLLLSIIMLCVCLFLAMVTFVIEKIRWTCRSHSKSRNYNPIGSLTFRNRCK